MDDFRIGEIVIPKMQKSRDKYGVGMIEKTEIYPRERVNVFFPSKDVMFQERWFSPKSLQRVNAPEKLRRKILTVYDRHNELIEEFKIVL